MKPVRFRVVLPLTYVIIAAALVLMCFLHLGHASWCDRFLQSMFPGSLLHGVLLRALLAWRVVQPDSHAWQILDEILLVPLPLAITIGQYFLIGWIVDRLRDR
jgi:hypothetical protein